MKIAFTTTYSHPSVSGVWSYVYNISKELIKKGHEIHVFSSDLLAGSKKRLPAYEFYEGIHIHRCKTIFSISDNVALWSPKKKMLKIKPDVIFCNTYRHPESLISLNVARKLNIPCFLITHAPFMEKQLRNLIQNFGVLLYDSIYKNSLKKFKKVIANTKWETPYLLKLGCPKEKIIIIPLGVDKDFLKINPHGTQIIHMGRIVPIKNVALLIKAFEKIKTKKLKIIGPLFDNLPKLPKNVILVNKPYNKQEQINEFKKSNIFVTASNREVSGSLVLLEAMASGLLCISADNEGAKETLADGRGILFKRNDLQDLISKLRYAIENYDNLKGMREKAREFARERTWKRIAKEVEQLYEKYI